jgi:hypothetical protein
MLRFSGMPVSTQLNALHGLVRHNVLQAWQHTHGDPLIPIGQVGAGLTASLPEFAGRTTIETVVGGTTAPVLDTASPYYAPYMWSGSELAAAVMCGAGGPTGSYGVAWGSPFAHVKAFVQPDPSFLDMEVSDAALAQAIERLWQLGCKIIPVTMTPRWRTGSGPLTQAACNTVHQGGGLIVAAAGDGLGDPQTSSSTIGSPGDIATTLVVGSAFISDEAIAMPTYVTQGAFGSRVDIVGVAGGHQLSNTLAEPMFDLAHHHVAAGFVAGVAHLVKSANTALTGAQIKQILISTADPSQAGWAFSGFYPNAAGFPDAERAVLRAKAMGADDGTVFPYLRLHGQGTAFPYEIWNTDPSDRGVRHVVKDGEYRVLVNGAVGAEIGGYCYAGGVEDPITGVQLWLDNQKVYPAAGLWGAPTSRALDNLHEFTSYRNDYWDVRVTVQTQSGRIATRTYDADYAANPALALS